MKKQRICVGVWIYNLVILNSDFIWMLFVHGFCFLERAYLCWWENLVNHTLTQEQIILFWLAAYTFFVWSLSISLPVRIKPTVCRSSWLGSSSSGQNSHTHYIISRMSGPNNQTKCVFSRKAPAHFEITTLLLLTSIEIRKYKL